MNLLPGIGQPTALRAGPLRMELVDGALRYIRCGEEEIIRRIYVAVRDSNWGTVPGEIGAFDCKLNDDSFEIAFSCRHRQGDINFEWTARIEGAASGRLRFSMNGLALSSFLKNRIGFCVLHPMSCAGKPCLITYSNGSQLAGAFPRLIAPEQPVKHFDDLAALEHKLDGGGVATLRFHGDLFEMEDQRNWTDASFKIFCTPLHRPYPVRVEEGQAIQQEITLDITGAPTRGFRERSADSAQIVVDSRATYRFPELGLGCAHHGDALTQREGELLRELRLSHLRVDLDLTSSGWTEALDRAAADARTVGAALEVALFLDARISRPSFHTLRSNLIASGVVLRRILVFPSLPELITACRDSLCDAFPSLQVGGGTNAYFAQLNQERPCGAAMDCVAWSIHPQEHAFDDDSLIETLAAQAETVRSCRALYPHQAVAVSPITLRKRFNPYAKAPEPPPAPDELPPQVDPRQLSEFTAGWTLGSIKYLVEAGASSLTYFETTGWRGIIERSSGSPLPSRFRSMPGQIFPVYHVFAALATTGRPARILASRSSQPLRVECLAISHPGGTRLLLANFACQETAVEIVGMPGGGRIRLSARSFQVLDYPPTA